MKYVLLSNKKGVLLTRAPENLTSGLVLEFVGYAPGQHAVINVGEKVIYRDITEGSCFVESFLIQAGIIYISVKSENGDTIKCDSLTIFKDETSLYAIMNTDERDAELPNVRAELAALDTTMNEVKSLVEKLRKRLSDIYDGVDIL